MNTKYQKYLFPLLVVTLTAAMSACGKRTDVQKTPAEPVLREWVGDIAPNPELDEADFSPCNRDSQIKQYFNFGFGPAYEGEKPALVRFFQERYRVVPGAGTGLIRIRFVVNCKGETGRFRLQGMDQDYNEHDFPPELTEQLLQITRLATGWKLLPNPEEAKDYYQYLIFKIEEGHLTEILP